MNAILIQGKQFIFCKCVMTLLLEARLVQIYNTLNYKEPENGPFCSEIALKSYFNKILKEKLMDHFKGHVIVELNARSKMHRFS